MSRIAVLAERDIAKELGISPHAVCLVGSTLICGEGNDRDFLCLIRDDDPLILAGFTPDEDHLLYDSEFVSWRRENGDNVIAVKDLAFFLAEVATAHAARMANNHPSDLSERGNRVNFHAMVRSKVTNRLHALRNQEMLEMLG